MLELTKEECMELERRVVEKLHSALPDSDSSMQRLYETISHMASRAAIMTIREYERLQVEKKNQPPASP